MRGHVRHRGDERLGSWEYIVDIRLAAAQRCTVCNKRLWIERRPAESCPKCGGALRETEERRRETKAGFATQRECQQAMNKLLVSVEAHNYLLARHPGDAGISGGADRGAGIRGEVDLATGSMPNGEGGWRRTPRESLRQPGAPPIARQR